MTQIKHERSTQDLVRAAVSGWLGTALEFMDFQLYSLGAALVFHEIFFPEQSAAMALILAMGTYLLVYWSDFCVVDAGGQRSRSELA